MKISIIIPFCDKDYSCIPELIEEIKQFTFDYEVIFVDDRFDKTIDIKREYNLDRSFKVIYSSKTGENVGTFEARRTGTLEAVGDYIWYVDVDDIPHNITRLPYSEEDIVAYMYDLLTDGDVSKFNMWMNIPFINMNFNNKNIEYLLYITKHTLWNKLLKRKVLIKTYKDIPILNGFKNYEDGYLLFEMMKHSKTISLKFDTIYTYLNAEYQDKMYTEDKNSNNLFERIDSKIHKDCIDRDEFMSITMKLFND